MTPFWYVAGVAYECAVLAGLLVFLLAACWRDELQERQHGIRETGDK